ncbi:MAG: hypothetical protein J6Y60_03560 [Treponema sp.]|nr:hypothetical protein [Treponema sp.]
MIDVESKVFDTVYNSLILLMPDVNVTAGYDPSTAVYPTVTVSETGNVPVASMNTDDCAENHTRLTYEIYAISNKQDTGRSECKAIIDAVDGIMQGMKFRRIHKNAPVNINRTLWRMYARYEVIVGKPVEIDGDTVYQMYRR